MKEITIGNHTFQWKTEFFDYGWPDRGHYKTLFYNGTYTETYKKWLFLGPTITKVHPQCVFMVDIDISRLDMTNAEVNKEVTEAYTRWVGLSERSENVLQGNYI